MITPESVKTALRASLPATPHAHIANLAKLVAEAASGFISPDDVQAHLAAEPAVASLLQALAGRTIEAGTSTISFGSGNSIGSITIGKVAGHDLIEINLYPQRPPLGVPFQAPPLPAHFVPRPVVSRDLKARLLADGPTAGSLVVSAVHGLGGVGKSTLAADLAHDSEVMERFPDGVLWATLGQQPDLLPLLSGWVQALGDYNFKPLGKEAATSHLRTLLHDKAALLVVDDAWDPAQVPPFLVGGPAVGL